MTQLNIAPGVLVADRFEVETLAGVGGMGLVFRARDRHTGQVVALKLLQDTGLKADRLERFWREAQTLAELRHPGIAAHVAHGRTAQGEPFLAMEWLEGESLAARLRRSPLSLGETLALARAVAAALATVHRRGIVHRDIKPSNLLLRDGRAEGATLLDFGLARFATGALRMTRTGEVMGSLYYLAPEQARGERQIGPAVDIYALGCVLFECLDGAPPFGGQEVAVVLARILCEMTPPLRQRRPEIPEALAELLGKMLFKRAEDRPADGAALVEALAGLGTLGEPPGEAPRSLTASMLPEQEQQLVSVIVAASPSSLEVEPSPQAGDTPDAAPELAQLAELRQLLQPLGAQIDRLVNGMLLVTFTSTGQMATDQAVQAGRCAQILRERLPEAMVAVATGRGRVTQRMQVPIGEAIERAMRLLRAEPPAAPASPAIEWVGSEDSAVRLDEVTASLLGSRFHVLRVGTGTFAMTGEREMLDETRCLLGRPTPCVGREQELGLLEALLDGCWEEEEARAVLVLAPAGLGKSRLRHEFLRRLEARGEAMEVLGGRGDPMYAGAPHGLLGQALRRLCGVEDGAAQETRREQLAARLGRYLAASRRQQVVEFLGELCGVPFPDDDSPRLRAARQEPRVMSDLVAEALVAFLDAECAVHPVLLVLEDLHWGDSATVRMVDVALRELAERPLFVLALGRPEIKELFPRLWEERKLHELRLPALSRKAGERLAREVLGAQAAPETITRIVTQAGGNALFLEELIRAVAEGTGEVLPETVLAMLQARFLRLDPGARRVLRAASFFGETFWRGGLAALLGIEHRADEIDRWLGILVEAETVVRQRGSRFPRETEYSFRHALLRDAAYSLLDDADRQLGHRLAGEYLERVGEGDPLVLAEHYRRGGVLGRAAFYYARCAEQTLDNNDAGGALHRVEQGLACGATGEVLGTLLKIQGWAHLWSWNIRGAIAAGQTAASLLPPRSYAWYRANAAALGAIGLLGQYRELLTLVEQLSEAPPLAGAEGAFVEHGLAPAVFYLCLGGFREATEAYLGRMEAACAGLGDDEFRARGMFQICQFYYHKLLTGDPWPYLCTAEENRTTFTLAGDRRYVAAAQGHMALARALLGDHERARGEFQALLTSLERMQEALMLATMQAHYAIALVEADETELWEEARRVAETVLRSIPAPNLWSGLGRCALASALAGQGELAAAEEEARRALEMLAVAPPGRTLAFAVLCRSLLSQGRATEARQVADEGLALLAELGGSGWMDVKLRLVAAEVYDAVDDRAAARAVLTAAQRQIQRRAGQIPDAAIRARFLGQVTHVRVQELARALGL
jgi:serine/threonine protein kinase/tetratricopeptide (TPR) repeat protein